MSWAHLLDLLGLVLGLCSGAFFAWGVLDIKGDTIEAIATGAWELPGRAIAIELTQQKADFRFGFGFLGVSFLLQFISKAFLDEQDRDAVYWGTGIALVVLVPAVLMLGCFFWLKHVRRKRVNFVEKVVVEKCRPQVRESS